LVAGFAETFIGDASTLREPARQTTKVAIKVETKVAMRVAMKVRGTRNKQRSEADPGEDEGRGSEEAAEQALPEGFVSDLRRGAEGIDPLPGSGPLVFGFHGSQSDGWAGTSAVQAGVNVPFARPEWRGSAVIIQRG